MIKKYIKKPVKVEAIKLDIPNNDREVLEFIGYIRRRLGIG